MTFAGEVIAETTGALTVRETSHPPTWYLPLSDVRRDLLRPADGTSFCEWKGNASYVDIVAGGLTAAQAGWYYAEPTEGYERLRDHVAFYAGRVHRVTVDGAGVVPQPGGFYGGWITPDVVGPFKGVARSSGW